MPLPLLSKDVVYWEDDDEDEVVVVGSDDVVFCVSVVPCVFWVLNDCELLRLVAFVRSLEEGLATRRVYVRTSAREGMDILASTVLKVALVRGLARLDLEVDAFRLEDAQQRILLGVLVIGIG